MGEPTLVVRNACFCDCITNVDPACPECAGTGNDYRTPTTADHVADLVALPPAERVARLVALLRAVPDEAVQAVDGCKVARAWKDGMRERLNDVSAGCLSPVAHAEEAAHGETDAALLADGWALAGRMTP